MIKTIAIVGPESSGKTELCLALAKHFGEPVALEYAREYLEKRDGSYRQSDLVSICQGQVKSIEVNRKIAKDFVFTDTDPWSIRIWSEIKYGQVDDKLKTISQLNPEFYYLLCEPDIPYQEDPLRENPALEDRMEIFRLFQSRLELARNFLGIVNGLDVNRKKNALNLINLKFPR